MNKNTKILFKKRVNILGVISVQLLSGGIFFLLNNYVSYTPIQQIRAGVIYTLLGTILWFYSWNKNE